MIKEAGVGLACEEAVRMYLSDDEPVRFFIKEIDEEPDDLEFDSKLLETMLFARTALPFLITGWQSERLPSKLCRRTSL